MPVNEAFSCDNSGNRVPPTAQMVDPVAASGVTITMAVSGTDYTQTLVAGQLYAITFISTTLGKRMLASITGVTSTAANIEWVFVANVTYIFRMPFGKTTLYCESDETTGLAYVRKVSPAN
jgi:hypothetical protein